jgi:hypothetical protein
MRRMNMKKIIGAMCAVCAALLVLLPGCPTDTAVGSDEEYIDAAVLLNERAKYSTAATFSFDEGDAGTDVTGQFIQLKPGKTANREVAVSISGADGSGYFDVQDGKIIFTGLMPLEKDFVKEKDASGESDDKEIFDRGGISNAEVITLSFRKGEESATLDVLGVIRRKGTPDPERVVIAEGDTFVLYGYDVIKSGSINRGDVKLTTPILDMAKVNAANMVTDSVYKYSNWTSVAEDSVLEMLEKINASLSVGYEGPIFGGKVESEFSSSTGSKQTRHYAKGRGLQITLQEHLKYSQPSVLKNFLDETFKMYIQEKDAKDILDTYGTHLIVQCYWGGAAEFNYSYTGTELATAEDIRVALNASYGGFSGAASGGYSEQVNELNKNSSFSCSTHGGANTSYMTAEQFMAGYKDWVTSVEADPDLCAILNFEKDLVPIWKIVREVNPHKGSEIEAEFAERVQTRGIALKDFVYVPPEETVHSYTYVTEIDVREQKGGEIPYGYNQIVRNSMYDPNYGDILDANQEAEGAWIRIPYKTEIGNNNHNAIAELNVVNTGKSATPPSTPGWTTIPFDLNEDAGGYYIWLQYRRVNSSDTAAIDFIGSYSNEYAGSGQILPGYFWVNRVDLNAGAGGNYIYLTVHKSPFTW